MDYREPSSIEDHEAPGNDGYGHTAAASPEDKQTRNESSEDDDPIIARHRRRPAKKSDEKFVAFDRRPVHEGARKSSNLTRGRPVSRQPPVPTPKTAAKLKKPGPKPLVPKPVKKNDMEAKEELIREVEGYWGKGFIKSYVPKCHRPLVKRGKSGKRSAYRDHEIDPRNWLPSVLKAILMIARLTDDKAWLNKAMNDVVRYRIKNTGNRKPQLVTTDFDVIEDMLVKQWTVAYSFDIRYKHLLVGRKDRQGDDEDIDHILQVSSSDVEFGSENSGNNKNNGDGEEGDDEDEDEENLEGGQGDSSGNYLQSNGYIKASPYSSPELLRQQQRLQNTSHGTSPKQLRPRQPHQNMLGHGDYGPFYPPTDSCGRPLVPYGGYEGSGSFLCYVPYGGYGGYGPPHHREGRESRSGMHPPNAHVMLSYTPTRHPMPPMPEIPEINYGPQKPNSNTCQRDDYEQTPDLVVYGSHSSLVPNQTAVKRESTAYDESPLVPSCEVSDGDLDSQDEDDPDRKALLDAELETVELELKLAKLKARQAALRQKNNNRV